MRNLPRLPPALSLSLSLLASLGPTGCGCEPEKVEQQRDLLKPKERARARAELVDKRRVKTADGKLRASDQEIAGVVLPRGIELHREFDDEWYYWTVNRQVTLERLEAFFRPQLITLNLKRHKTGALWFLSAQIKRKPASPLVTLRISPILDGTGRNEIYIRRAPPAAKQAFPSRAEAEAQLEARRKYAD